MPYKRFFDTVISESGIKDFAISETMIPFANCGWWSNKEAVKYGRQDKEQHTYGSRTIDIDYKIYDFIEKIPFTRIVDEVEEDILVTSKIDYTPVNNYLVFTQPNRTQYIKNAGKIYYWDGENFILCDRQYQKYGFPYGVPTKLVDGYIGSRWRYCYEFEVGALTHAVYVLNEEDPLFIFYYYYNEQNSVITRFILNNGYDYWSDFMTGTISYSDDGYGGTYWSGDRYWKYIIYPTGGSPPLQPISESNDFLLGYTTKFEEFDEEGEPVGGNFLGIHTIDWHNDGDYGEKTYFLYSFKNDKMIEKLQLPRWEQLEIEDISGLYIHSKSGASFRNHFYIFLSCAYCNIFEDEFYSKINYYLYKMGEDGCIWQSSPLENFNYYYEDINGFSARNEERTLDGVSGHEYMYEMFEEHFYFEDDKMLIRRRIYKPTEGLSAGIYYYFDGVEWHSRLKYSDIKNLENRLCWKAIPSNYTQDVYVQENIYSYNYYVDYRYQTSQHNVGWCYFFFDA